MVNSTLHIAYGKRSTSLGKGRKKYDVRQRGLLDGGGGGKGKRVGKQSQRDKHHNKKKTTHEKHGKDQSEYGYQGTSCRIRRESSTTTRRLNSEGVKRRKGY